MSGFRKTLIKELHFIRQDAWLKALLFWLPILLTVILLGIFSAGTATNLSIGVVDNDNSSMSRALIRYYDASPALQVNKHYSSVNQASQYLRNNTIYAVAVIPTDLEKNTLLGKSPQVTVFYNSQFILIGKLINSAIIKAQGTYTASIETFKDLINTQGQVEQAIGEAVPISSDIIPLFNANTHYGQFLVTAAVPAIWQIIIVATIVLSFASKHSLNSQTAHSSLSDWLSKFTYRTIIIKLLPYIVIFWGQGILFLYIFYNILGWPMHGSWLILILAQLLLVIACACMATLFFFISLDGARSMSLVAGFTAPAFAFMGVTFPTTDMPWLALFWRALLPISHYSEIQMEQVNYGTNFISSAPHFIALLSFIICLFFAIFLIDKHKRKVIT